MIRLSLPHCEKRTAVYEIAAVKKEKCPGCGETVRIPPAVSADTEAKSKTSKNEEIHNGGASRAKR